jgi:hypothetical protein
MSNIRQFPDYESLMLAYHQGAQCAASMLPGAVFRGAIPEALAAGHERDSASYQLFVSGFCEALALVHPHGVRADRETGIIC